MVHIALLLLIYVTAPPFGPRLTTTKLGEDHFRTIGPIPENPGPKYWRAATVYTEPCTCPLQCVDKRQPCKISIGGAKDGGQTETMWTDTYAGYHSTSSKRNSPTMMSTEYGKSIQIDGIKVGQTIYRNSMPLDAYFMIWYPNLKFLQNVRGSTFS